MTDRDRLIELIQDIKDCNPTNWHKPEFMVDSLLANGVIVPPCKVGDKIYMLVTRHTLHIEYPNGKTQRVKSQHTFIKETYLTELNFFKVLDDFGKTVFLTKEEAEKALKERSG